MHTIVRDITRETQRAASIYDIDVDIEVEVDEQGGYRIWASSVGHGAEPMELHIAHCPAWQHEGLEILMQEAEKLAKCYADAWYRGAVQEAQSRARLRRHRDYLEVE